LFPSTPRYERLVQSIEKTGTPRRHRGRQSRGRGRVVTKCSLSLAGKLPQISRLKSRDGEQGCAIPIRLLARSSLPSGLVNCRPCILRQPRTALPCATRKRVDSCLDARRRTRGLGFGKTTNIRPLRAIASRLSPSKGAKIISGTRICGN
jgi:hypothetical protein